jgi:hypothetical protein
VRPSLRTAALVAVTAGLFAGPAASASKQQTLPPNLLTLYWNGSDFHPAN